MTVAKCGAGSTYPSGAHEFTSSFQWGIPVTIDLLLFGDDILHINEKFVVFSSVQKYIKYTKRFSF
jgi:hypothetical protein